MNAWQGKLVTLRALSSDDADVLQRAMGDSLTSFMSDVVPYPPPREVVERAGSQAAEGDDVTLAITDADGHLVGWVQAMRVRPRHGLAHVGVGILDPRSRRKGYASDAICVLLRHLFDERRCHKVQADVFAYNEASQHLFTRLGFTREGCLRENHYAGGRFWDTLVFGLTAAEFRARHADYRIDWFAGS